MVEINSKIKEIIENNALAFATVDENKNPHCIAVAFVKAVSDNKILITDNYISETRQNIERSPKISLTVWSRKWEEDCRGYELKGIAEYHKNDEWHKRVKNIPENQEEPCKGAILVEVEKIKDLA